MALTRNFKQEAFRQALETNNKNLLDHVYPFHPV